MCKWTKNYSTVSQILPHVARMKFLLIKFLADSIRTSMKSKKSNDRDAEDFNQDLNKICNCIGTVNMSVRTTAGKASTSRRN